MRGLEEICAQLDDSSRRAKALVEWVPRAMLGRRPDEGAWSVAECLEHLTLTTDAYLPVLGRAIAEGRSKNLVHAGGGFRMGLTARMLAWWLEPPYRMRSKTTAAFLPGMDEPSQALPRFLDRQEKLLQVVADADGLALDRLMVASPFAERLRYSVYAAFCLIAVHERRHLWQAGEVARHMQKPDAGSKLEGTL